MYPLTGFRILRNNRVIILKKNQLIFAKELKMRDSIILSNLLFTTNKNE